MTRVVNGIYDDIVLDTGFFVTDKEVDLLCDWLAAYADALEKAWKRNGSPAKPTPKHVKVRSFINAVARKRKGEDKPPATPKAATKKN